MQLTLDGGQSDVEDCAIEKGLLEPRMVATSTKRPAAT
jgi:hypothetical protein